MPKQHSTKAAPSQPPSGRRVAMYAAHLRRLNRQRLQILDHIKHSPLPTSAEEHRHIARKIAALQGLDDEIYRLETTLAGLYAQATHRHMQAHLGSRIRLKNADEDIFVRLVPAGQTDIAHGLLPLNSDVGRQLVGKTPGARVTIPAAGATRKTYEIIAIDDGL